MSLEIDSATYTLHGGRGLVAILRMHEDDGIFARSKEGVEALGRFSQKFSVGDFHSGNFAYTGVRIRDAKMAHCSESTRLYPQSERKTIVICDELRRVKM